MPSALMLGTGIVDSGSMSGGIGLDPVFQIWSNLWSLDVTGEEDQYYNMTQVLGWHVCPHIMPLACIHSSPLLLLTKL